MKNKFTISIALFVLTMAQNSWSAACFRPKAAYKPYKKKFTPYTNTTGGDTRFNENLKYFQTRFPKAASKINSNAEIRGLFEQAARNLTPTSFNQAEKRLETIELEKGKKELEAATEQ